MKRVLAWVFFSSFLPACTVSSSHSERPWPWSLAPGVHSGDVQQCPQPVGLFSNEGEISDPNATPVPLAHLLFDDRLRGYPVEAVRVSATAGTDKLVANGVLAGVPLKASREIIPTGQDCYTRWRLLVDSGVVDSQLRTEAVLLTSGVLLPLSEVFEFDLAPADDGALLVNIHVRAWILAGLLFPMRADQQFWMRYPLVSAGVNIP